MQPYSGTDTVSAWKNSDFILSEISDFHMVGNLSIAVYVLAVYIDITFSRWDIATEMN